jgi:hypothetical protein
MSSYDPHLNPYTNLGNVICFNYIAFHILDVEHLENFNGTKRIGRAARREHFELLDVSPGPNRTSSDNLATPGSPMLTPSLVRTMVQRDTIDSLGNL